MTIARNLFRPMLLVAALALSVPVGAQTDKVSPGASGNIQKTFWPTCPNNYSLVQKSARLFHCRWVRPLADIPAVVVLMPLDPQICAPLSFWKPPELTSAIVGDTKVYDLRCWKR